MTRQSSLPLFDLNVELRRVDLMTDRVAMRVSNRLQSRSYRAATGGPDVKFDDIEEDFFDTMTKCMMTASVIAGKTVSKFLARRRKGRFEASEVTDILKGASKEEKDALKELYGSIARSVTDDTMSKIREEMLTNIADVVQRRPNRLRARVRSFSGGPKNTVRTVLRTQSAIAFNASAWVTSLRDDELWGFEYVTARDERVRPSHDLLEGARYPKEHEFWAEFAPPNGWNCRCGLNPIFKGDSDARIRRHRGNPTVDKAFSFNPGSLFTRVA